MERQDERPTEVRGPQLKTAVRVVVTLMVFGLAVWGYFAWLQSTRAAQVPPVTLPQPWVYEEQQSVDALLIWQEEVLRSPRSGSIQLAGGGAADTVGKNEVLATLLSGGRTLGLRSPARGYFLPWTDGQEGQWNYQTYWPGTALFPPTPPALPVGDLQELGADLVIGKLIPLPQWPRALFYLNLTDDMAAALKRGELTFRFEPHGTTWRAKVRVWLSLSAQMAKVAVELPLFPLWMTRSRRLRMLVCAGERPGMLVPESAAVMRQGSWGVYDVEGNRIVYRPVQGWPLGDGRFFVAGGLELGSPVILDGAKAVERRVELW